MSEKKKNKFFCMSASAFSNNTSDDEELFITLKNEPKGYDVQTLQYHDTVREVWRDCVVQQQQAAATAATATTPAATDTWYNKSEQYWKDQPADVNGMLGGFEFLHGDDIAESKAFLVAQMPLLRERLRMRTTRASASAAAAKTTSDEPLRALDVGAGIGRITKYLLTKLFDKVDLMDVVPEFVQKAPSYIDDTAHLGDCYCCPMQEFSPA